MTTTVPSSTSSRSNSWMWRYRRRQAAYEDALRETSTTWAPWHVVPADRKWQRNLLVAQVLVAALREMDPRIPDAAAETAGVVIPD